MRLSRIELKFLKRGVYCIFDIAYSGNNPNPALQVPPIILQANIVVPQMQYPKYRSKQLSVATGA